MKPALICVITLALTPILHAQSVQFPPGGGSGQGFIYTGVLSGIPATCTQGQISFITNATPGQNIYEATGTSPCSWTQQLNSGSGGASAALDNLSAVSINTSLLAQTGVDLGSAAKAMRELYFWGTGTFGTTSMKLTGVPTAARVWTFQDATDTVVGRATTDTLTNKSIDAGQLTGSVVAARMPALTGDCTTSAGAVAVTCGAAIGRTGNPLSQFAATTSAQLRGALSDESGTGAALFQSGDLGTPTAGVGTNLTGIPVSTGISGLAAGMATFLGTPSSANLASALTDETGSGAAVFGTAPTMSAPVVTGLADFSGGNFKMPTGAGFAATSTNMFGYDSTNTNPHIWDGADGILAPFASAPTTGRCVQTAVVSGKITLVDSGSTNCGGGGATALSAVTAATTGNTIANGDNAQIWNWATTTSGKIGFTFGETTASTSAGTPYLLKLNTLIGSTAIPMNISNSLNGSQTLASLAITPTWNTTGVVDAALLINPTNTASGAASKLIDAQVGGATQWNVDKAGNSTQTGVASALSVSTGSSPPASAWFTGTSGLFGLNTGTNVGTVPAGAGFLISLTGNIPTWLTSTTALPVVQGPVSSTNLNLVQFSGTTGGLVSDTGFLASNVVRKDAANTGVAAMTLDMSASTSAAAIRLPNIAGASSTTAGAASYDTTNKNLHVGANGVDNILALFPSSVIPTNGNCPKWVVAANVVTLSPSDACAGGGTVTSSGSPLIHQVPVFTTGTDIKGLAVGGNNTVLRGSAAADPAFGALVAADLPSTLTSGTAITNAALTTPTLGTPASGTMTNVTGLPLTTGVTGILPLANGGTNCAAPFPVLPKTATYQVLAADFTCFTTITVASGTFTITLVASGAQPVAGTWIKVINYGTGVVTIARSGQNINGGTGSIVLESAGAVQPTNAFITSDGTNYFSSSGFTNPMTAIGQEIYAGTTGLPTALAAGTAKQLKLSGGAGAPSWIDFPDVKVYPAANCVNAVAGSGWSSTSTGMPAACRAGTNNFNGVLQPIPSTGGTAYLDTELPGDWDTAVKPYISVYYASGANTSGTVIWTISTGCTKQDGSVSDDPSWIAESAMGTQTMAVANRMWAQNAQLAGAMTNCIAGSTMFVKAVLSGTAASAINVSKIVITTPRLLTVQAN